MLTLKSGARILGLRPEMLVALLVAEGAYREMGLDCRMAHGIDGAHMRASEHYTGLAVDLTIQTVPLEKREGLRVRLVVALGGDFDVLWEAQGTPNEHLHVEYDPKEPY